jgi:hypothetical protein
MGHVLGAEKEFFLIRGDDVAMVRVGRASGILSIRGPEVSLGSPRVGTIHVQAPTPHTPPLPAYFGQFSQQCGPLNHELLGNGFQSSRAPQESAHAVSATTRPQIYPGGSPRADLPPKKVTNLDPMAPRSRKKRQLPEAPQES